MLVARQVIATLICAGEQPVTVDAQGSGRRATLSVGFTPASIVVLHDRLAVQTYACAFLDAIRYAVRLPQRRAVDLPQRGITPPHLLIHARHTDQSCTTYDLQRRELHVRIGYVTWAIVDRDAYNSLYQGWRAAEDMAGRLDDPPVYSSGVDGLRVGSHGVS